MPCSDYQISDQGQNRQEAHSHSYYSETTQRYTNSADEYIYFEGTDPRHPGVPPQEPRGVKTPREYFEEGLTVQEWYDYTGLE